MTFEGIPDGWEPVRFDYANDGDAFLGGHGEILVHLSPRPTQVKRLIIRKIEKPKRYRAFENAAEAEPFFDRRLRYKACCNAIMRITVLGKAGLEVAKDKYTYKEAFDRFECTDGTPFGIEVTE